MPEFIYPDWSAPEHVKALTTTRVGGYSKGPFESFNLSMRSGDDTEQVKRNRALLVDSAGLPSEPVWLRQEHGNKVVDASCTEPYTGADGSYTDQAGIVCVVLTADCCPVFLCDRQGSRVGVLHAGWRGLARGLIEQGVQQTGRATSELMAWLGPAIGPSAFEVGDDVYNAFVDQDAAATETFVKNSNGRWLADIYALATQRLRAMGVENISGGTYCTVQERERFFSYRRDRLCGHMASLIWLDAKN
ncbi:MAG: peptidoglycan editing factor PgeF [Acidiferrobacterales bacterium]